MPRQLLVWALGGDYEVSSAFDDAKITFNGVEFPITEVTYSYDRENGHREERLLGPSPTGHFTIKTEMVLTDEGREFFKWLGWSMFRTDVTPDGTVGRACIGVHMWRSLADWILPLHRRPSISGYWRNALAARYFVNTGRVQHKGVNVRDARENVLLGFYVSGNQREVLEAYDRIRREAGDFEADELGGLN
jgi:hypothetical protein